MLPSVQRRSWWALALAAALFALGFAVANRFQLTHGVLYRAAANDWASAAGNFLALAIQAAVSVAGIWAYLAGTTAPDRVDLARKW